MSQIIILAPANAETGGVEDLHQLCGALEQRGVNVSMAFVNNSAINDCTEWNPAPFLCNNEIRQRYLQYASYKQVLDIPDTKDTVIIAPEIYQRALIPLKNALPCVWFLAAFPLVSQWKGRKILPIAQSRYAIDMLETQGFKAELEAVFLPDYLSPQIIPALETVEASERPVSVCYYGGRGKGEVVAILNSLGAVGVCLFGLSAEELSGHFIQCKHFIYPARQPGMDKTPREAAVNGCVVWVLADGAGAVPGDVPLPSEFICETFAKMRDGLAASMVSNEEYTYNKLRQQDYRAWIRGARYRFERGVTDLLERIAECI